MWRMQHRFRRSELEPREPRNGLKNGSPKAPIWCVLYAAFSRRSQICRRRRRSKGSEATQFATLASSDPREC
eukprot:7525425-Alexandrium_andersonii.AAC.1